MSEKRDEAEPLIVEAMVHQVDPALGSPQRAGDEEVLQIELDKETLDALGEDPSLANAEAVQLHSAICTRWKPIIASGLEKSASAELGINVKVVERANTALQGSPQTQSIAKITIESINLKVPHLTPNDDIKLQLLTRIKADESMMIPFRRWKLHELPALTQGSTIEIWSVKTCSALDSPRYVIVFFQTKKADNMHEDVTLFDNANIKSIRLALNSDYYPQERMLLDFSKDQYADAHFNYTEFNKSYHNCQEKRSLVNFAEFKSRPMFVIDCSRRYLGDDNDIEAYIHEGLEDIAPLNIENAPNNDLRGAILRDNLVQELWEARR
ncbi:unnamed protein product [Phaedon cochleariae]|uniref:Double jelly roll-like domain-containing protein n=1 Tax=Phaedon cochleariae TaxID=80249 RepID=A0A9N9X3U4_PHACE|nr:unnamed protein product [Phaedon cochleariae]